MSNPQNPGSSDPSNDNSNNFKQHGPRSKNKENHNGNDRHSPDNGNNGKYFSIMVGSLAGAGNVAIVDSPTIVTASFPRNRTELWAYISIRKDQTPKSRVGLSRTAEKGVARH